MEAFQNLHRPTPISTPLPAATDSDIASLSPRRLQDFCAARELSAEGDEGEPRERIRGAGDAAVAEGSVRGGAGEGEAAAAANAASEFSDDDDELAAFDVDAAVARSRLENRHPDLSDGQTRTQRTPAKRPFRPEEASGEKRLKTPDDSDGATPPSHESTREPAPERLDARLPPSFLPSLLPALSRFGLASFRPGQLSVIHAVLEKRDACAFWATGAGKSLGYQLPPLHLGEVGVVVTPLVSLMMDQCAKLNSRVGGAATYLGASQTDPTMEMRALEGEFRLIYVTPEKLAGGDFLDRLARMHERGGRGRVCLFAVDESHCVSEWGHDFRPEFLKIGSSLRTHPVLSSVPILALTATAVPRVRADILSSLRMRDAIVVKKSFDRANLKIVVKRKPKNGIREAFGGATRELAGGAAKSTIVYCATRREVEEVSDLLSDALAHALQAESKMEWSEAKEEARARIRPYHGALSQTARTEAHLSFLVGKTSVIVATVAFGMGIDKPDIRRVIHWGPPKTVEEYYQQIGRASRDGLFGECIMYADPGDFSKYHSSFYLGNLKPEAKEATVKSMNALRDFSMAEDVCRRRALMGFFEERPSFGEWCGTCDVCCFREVNDGELERDFALDGARVLLMAIVLLKKQAWSTIEKVLSGGSVESYRYSPSTYTLSDLSAERKRMKKKRSVAYIKELLPLMVERGYITTETRQSTHRYGKPYVVYGPGTKGHAALKKIDEPIILPVPAAIREFEVREAEKRGRALAELEAAGIDLQQIPEEELEEGDGPVIAAFRHWHAYLDRLEKSGRTEFVNQMDDLKLRIIAWRSDTAEKFRIAPTLVMEEHMMYKVAYATATLQSGRMEQASLVAAGVRSNGIEELTKVLGEWTDTVKASKQEASSGSENQQSQDLPMFVKPGECVTPKKPWQYSVYKPNKKTGMAAWEVSYVRFMKGEHPQSIAMKQSSGKAIQVATVVGHILEGLTQGRPVNLDKLVEVADPPTKSEWDNLARCELETGTNVTADPASSGKNGERFTMRDFLEPIMGNAFTTKDYKDRTPAESEQFNKWCGKLNWYLALRRVEHQPSFGSQPAGCAESAEC